MDTQIKIYEHPEFGKVRTQTDENGDIWFCASDVCNILKHTNTSKAISDFVDESDVTKRYTAFERSGAMLLYINESGLHSLIMGSKLPAAKQFKHWVTSEVLPSVRKHGAYLTPQAIEETLTNPDFIIGLATKLKEEQTRRKELEQTVQDNLRLIDEQAARIEEDKPKVIFHDSVAVSQGLLLIRDMAKLIQQNGVEMGEQKLRRLLREDGLLCKQGVNPDMPTQRAANLGIFSVREHSILHGDGRYHQHYTTKVTGKGQIYLIKKYAGKQATVNA